MHGYIPFTASEVMLLDRPFVQRMRYIRQSAAAHFVFPGMNVHRFEHSIGAMHVASRMFRATLGNLESAPSGARKDLRERIVAASCDAVGEDILSVPGDKRHEGRLREYEAAMRCQGLVGAPAATPRERVALMVVEQGLRFASLLHDIGHLPFSHDFEAILKEFFNEHEEAGRRWPHLAGAAVAPDPLHERIGRELARWATTQLAHESDGRSGSGASGARLLSASIAVARQILASATDVLAATDSDQKRLSRWLYELISGEIDADRCDYVLRDASHYGIPGATFDLDRLVAGMTVHEQEIGESSRRSWRVALLPEAVSAAEEFLVARSRLYGWAVYHHKSQQIAVSLRRALARSLAAALGQPDSDPVARFLASYDAVLDPGGNRSKCVPAIARFDDMWWLECLKRDVDFDADSPSAAEQDLRTALYRSPGRISLWKKPSDFESPDELRVLNGSRPRDPDAARRWNEVKTCLRRDHNVELCEFSFSPYRPAVRSDVATASPGAPESALTVVRIGSGRDSCEPLTTFSPAVRSLWDAWQASIQVLAFAGDTDTDRAGVIGTIRTAMEPDEVGL